MGTYKDAANHLENAQNELNANPSSPDLELIQDQLRMAHDRVYTYSDNPLPVEDFRTHYIDALHAILNRDTETLQQELGEMTERLEAATTIY